MARTPAATSRHAPPETVPPPDAGAAGTSADRTTARTASASAPGAGDFDFILGRWRVRHRRLKARLAGCREWVEFDGLSTTRKIMGGSGNLEDALLDLPDGAYRAAALRCFDPATATWSIWWLDGRCPGRLDPPVVGRFGPAAGVFHADDMLDGTPIRVRFTWYRSGPGAPGGRVPGDAASGPGGPRWEQAFSADGGDTWETNWTMDFARIGA